MLLSLPDAPHQATSVDLDSDGLGGPCTYTDDGWHRDIGEPRTQRIEYHFRVTDARGRVRWLLDPAARHTVQTAFGPKSVWRAPGYRPPAWLEQPATSGRVTELALASRLARPLPVGLWVPDGLADQAPAPLLWCHDGPEYAERSALLQWAGALIAAETLPPFRLALARPVRRNQWYSASPRYLASVDAALADLRSRYAVCGPLAVMGASLGGLTSTLVALRRGDVGALLSQSGSFFDPCTDGGDSGFRWFDRIAAAVRSARQGPPRRGTDLQIAMTCGRHEQNLANNEAMAQTLRGQGFSALLRQLPDLHNYVAWGDGLEPQWSRALADIW